MVDPASLDRTVVIGTTGSGKTTFGADLAGILGTPHIELDAVHWLPNWTKREEADFRERVFELAAGDAWVIDGNYRRVRDIVWGRATAVVWLDYPFLLTFWRLLRRSVGRIVRQEELFSGNRETVEGMFFSKDSLLLWAVKTHGRHRRSYGALRASGEYAQLSWYVFRRPAETRVFLTEVEAAVMQRGCSRARGGLAVIEEGEDG